MAERLCAGDGVLSSNGNIANRILKISRRLAAVDEVFAFVMREKTAPVMLGAASAIGDSRERTEHYARDFYQFDPMFEFERQCVQGEFVRRVLNADEIRKSDYRTICFDRPQLRQKISFEYADAAARIICNFYLRRPVGTARICDLEDVAAISMPSLMRLATANGNRATLIDRLESKLAIAYPRLTAREKEVIARTIAGWSSEVIAVDLGIGVGTALTYRRRAYARYEISSAGQFLEHIVT